MKLATIMTVAGLAGAAGAAGYLCCPEQRNANAEAGVMEVAEASSKQASINITGMTCGSCATTVKAVLNKVDGVEDVKVSMKQKRAVVTFDPAKTTAQALADTINNKTRFKATPTEKSTEKEQPNDSQEG